MATNVVNNGDSTSGNWEPPVRIEKDELVRISDALLAEPDIEFTETEDVFRIHPTVWTGISAMWFTSRKTPLKSP